MKVVRTVAILGGTLAIALSACSTSPDIAPSAASLEDRPLSSIEVPTSPRTLTGPNTAVLRDRHVEPVADAGTPVLPVTVTSHARGGDREVEVTDTSRIVAFDMTGSIAATVWGLGAGDRLVARDVAADFPGADKLPLVSSSGHAVNAEAVMAANPTVIITDGSMGPRDVVEQLADTGVPVIFVRNDPSFAGAQELAREVATTLGVPGAGELLATRIADQVGSVEQDIGRLVPTEPADRIRMLFLYVRGNAGVYYIFGDDSGASELIDSLGGVNVAEEQGWREMQPLTDEAMVAAEPDLIVMMSDGLSSVGGIDGLLAAKPAIALTSAGQNHRFVDMADGDILSFGPRSAAILEALARAVYTAGGPI